MSPDIGLRTDKGTSKNVGYAWNSYKVQHNYLDIQQTQEYTFDELPLVST